MTPEPRPAGSETMLPLYRACWRLARFVGRVVFGLRVEPSPPVLPPGACLIASNHKSYLDPPLIGASFPYELQYLAKEELFGMPILGPLIRRVGALPIRRGAGDRRSLTLCLRALDQGRPLLLFPEGTRIRRPGFERPRTGVAFLAVKSGAPVVPVYIGGTLNWGPAIRRRRPVRVRVGVPLQHQGEGVEAFSRRIMDAIRAMADPVDRAADNGD
ncbi:MAG: 1-acyl-sn-glycerol-3-phosphate acyltransferase [Candidatus Eisenbacteria bacterium]|nr:1-acyl-sn-glycerol-3-phosphate acyltransferase [Candidatus Eisenbacteria bacterium]